MNEDEIHIAFINSYAVIILDKKATDLIGGEAGWFAHNPKGKPTKHEMYGMLDYFEAIEDYEKCSEIKTYIDGSSI
jgi:hypothetical protein